MMKPLLDRFRKIVPLHFLRTGRMGLNYLYRLRTWGAVIWQVRPDDMRSCYSLWASAFASPITAWGDLYGWRDPILLHSANVKVREFGKFSLRPLSDDLYHVLPDREMAVIEIIKQRLRSGDIFIDAGANIGVFTVQAAKLVGTSGQVIAVEMMPDTAERLRHHIKLNACENVTLVECALADTVGQTVNAIVRSGHFGQATIARQYTQSGGISCEVATTTLEFLLNDIASVKLMKMDVEGSELLALRGAGAALAKVEAIIFESLDGGEDVPSFLIKSGYSLIKIDQSNYLAARA